MTKLLVVDDSTTVRLFYRAALEAQTVTIDEALNGADAIEKALVARYDLYIVDVNMDRMDGYTFLRRLRSCPDILQPPALMVSTEAKAHDVQAAYAAGANFFLSKPVKSDVLRRYVRILAGVKR
jgi:two-component system chemotaxis response regulator CheY